MFKKLKKAIKNWLEQYIEKIEVEDKFYIDPCKQYDSTKLRKYLIECAKESTKKVSPLESDIFKELLKRIKVKQKHLHVIREIENIIKKYEAYELFSQTTSVMRANTHVENLHKLRQMVKNQPTSIKEVEKVEKLPVLNFENTDIQYIFDYIYSFEINNIWYTLLKKVCEDFSTHKLDQLSSMRFPTSMMQERLKVYQQVNLAEHTSNLLRCYDKIKNESSPLAKSFKQFKPHVILFSCILHDIGKCSQIAEELNLVERDSHFHSKISKQYVDKILKNMVQFEFDKKSELKLVLKELDEISNAVYRHHNHNYNLKELPSILAEIDHKARAYELELAEFSD